MKSNANLCHFLLDNGTQCQNPVKAGKLLCELHSDSFINDVEIYKVATDHFRQDLSLFWTRANFYLIVQVGLLSVTAGNIVNQTTNVSSAKPINILLSAVGFVLAVFWFLVLRGSQFWIQRWRTEIIEMDKKISRFQSYAKIEPLVVKSPFLSPTAITKNLPFVFMIGWIVIGIAAYLAN